MNKEIWTDIPEWEDRYEINKLLGIVRAKSRLGNHYRRGTSIIKQKILEHNIGNRGYNTVLLYRNDSCKKRRDIHRILAEMFIPNPRNLPEVNHKNGIKTDNRVENLEWVTNSENQLHAVSTGLRENAIGENSNLSKLKNKDIPVIISLYKSGNYLQKEIADMYGIREETCNRIINRKTWKHII